MIAIDYTDRRPLYEQITERFQSLILCGALEKDSPLPSVRSLAMELSVNPNTIQRAYTELERRGVVYTVKGKGIFAANVTVAQKLRENEVEEDIKRLIQRAKEAGLSREKLELLIQTEWTGGINHD